ncbi:MAG: acyl-CoA dehydrogenase family protein [Acidimicrobiales bacterium]
MSSPSESPFRPKAFAAVCATAGSRSAEIEELRRLPRDLVDDLVDTGVFRLWIPRAYGGCQAGVQALLDAIELAAYHDGSTGWCVMIGGTTALNAGYLRADHAREIYGDPRAVTGGFGRPVGRAVVVDGGLRVSGHWSWGSGTSHCTWIGGGTRVFDAAGEPIRLPDGTVAPFVYFPAGEVDLDDNWDVMGLKGTASVDYRVEDAFVPEGRWAAMGAVPATVDDPVYRFSLLGALSLGVASVALGLGRRAVDELIRLGTKVPDASTKSLAERAPVQAELARSEASVRSARAWMAEVVGSASEAAADGVIGDEHKRLIREAANHAVAASAEAVDRCYTLGGGSAVFADNPLQRVFRDVHVATQHAMTAPRMWEPLGRMRFGLPTSTAQF